MDKDSYLDWLQSLDTDELVAMANKWGLALAKKLTSANPRDLQIFEEYLVDYYSNTVVPGREAYQYDQIKGERYEVA